MHPPKKRSGFAAYTTTTTAKEVAWSGVFGVFPYIVKMAWHCTGVRGGFIFHGVLGITSIREMHEEYYFVRHRDAEF